MNRKLPISLVVITFNEQQNIERCLRAADFCSELLVIDSGSTDRTTEIAARCGARVLNRSWSGYGDQKNFGSREAANDWILCIDADEVVTPELRTSIEQLFSGTPDVDGCEVNRHSVYGSTLINHSGWYPQWRMFLYRRDCAEWSGEEPHTTVVFRGRRSVRLSGDLLHYTYADISQHLRKNLSAARDWADAAFRNGRCGGLAGMLLRAPWSVFRCYVLSLGFLDGFYGLVIAAGAGHYTFMKYAMLFEKTRNARGHKA